MCGYMCVWYKWRFPAHQIVIGSNPEEFSEVPEGHGGVGFKPEVWEVVRWSQITALTEKQRKQRGGNEKPDCFVKPETSDVTQGIFMTHTDECLVLIVNSFL